MMDYKKQIFEPDEGYTNFQEAIQSNNLRIVLEKINGGFDVNKPNWMWGVTPLEIAVEEGSLEIVRVLLGAGADPNVGITASPLEISASRGCTKIFQELIKAGAVIEIQDSQALIEAARKGNLEIVQILVEAGVNPNRYSANMTLPLFEAMINFHQETYQYLSHFTSAENVYEINQSALIYAVESDEIETIKFIDKVGVDLNLILSIYGDVTALMLAAKLHKPEVVKVLLDLGIEVDKKNSSGKTALMYAARCQKIEHLQLIKSFTTAQVDKFLAPQIQVINYLREYGANLNTRDNKGKDSIDYATKFSTLEIVNLLSNLQQKQQNEMK